MSTSVLNKVYLRGILLHYFIQNKSATEAHRILVETCGEECGERKKLKIIGIEIILC